MTRRRAADAGGGLVRLIVPTLFDATEVLAIPVKRLFVHQALSHSSWVVVHWRGLLIARDFLSKTAAIAAAMDFDALPISWEADAPEVAAQLSAALSADATFGMSVITEHGGCFAGAGCEASTQNAAWAVARGTGPKLASAEKS